ncbi:hypothetical protein EMMF5_006532 [Cystobasidiomycetes sp. EMM_F5]
MAGLEPLLTSYHDGSSSFFVTAAYKGNIIGPLLFKPEDAPGYAPAFLIVVVTGIAAFILAFAYRYVCIWDNRRRDRKGVEAFDNALDDDLTDLKVSFYTSFRKTL